jgi:hypothetical protein
MDKKITSGQTVKLLSSLGLISVTVVADLGEVLLVCRSEEFKNAQKDRREPITVGFKRVDLVEIV